MKPRRSFPMIVVVLLAALAFAQEDPLAGTWTGALEPDGINLEIRVAFERTPAGLTGTFDIPPQGAFGIPLANIAATQDGAVRFGAPSLAGDPRFEGTLDGEAMTGTFTQGAARLPFRLTRAAAGAAGAPPERPQTPVPPFPYRVEDVTWRGPAGTLAGTLTLPDSPQPPVVLLINGSGAQDRDGTVMGHPTMAVLADALARRGLGALRWDDRGVGGSDGDLGAAGYDGLVEDVHSALQFLAGRGDVDATRLALLGHSEGGIIAPRAATELQDGPRVAALVLLAAPATDGVDLLVTQNEAIYALAGAEGADLDAQVAYLRALHAALLQGDEDAAVALTRERTAEQLAALPEAQRPADVDAVLDAAAAETRMLTFQDLVLSTPAEVLAKLEVPTLAIYAERDVQVIPDANAAVARRALEGTHEATDVVLLPGLNHLLQPAETGAVAEYAQIRTTIDAGALERIVTFLEQVLLGTPPTTR